MNSLDQTKLNLDIATIQVLHARLGLDLVTSMSLGTGNFWFTEHRNTKNIIVGMYLDILLKYLVIGDTITTEHYNILTVDDIQNIIDDSYRLLEPYNT